MAPSPPITPLVVELLQLLLQARQQQWTSAQLREALAPLHPRITATEQACCGQARALSQQPCPLPDPATA